MRRDVILIATPAYPPQVSGAATHFFQLANRLSGRTDVVVLSVRSKGFPVIERHGRLMIFRILPNVVKHNSFVVRLALLPIPTLMVILLLQHRYRIRVLHAHSSTAMILGVGIWSLCTQTPLILDVQDAMTPSWVLRLGRVRYYLATGNSIVQRLKQQGIANDKIKMIWSLPPDALRTRKLVRDNITKPTIQILFVGELNKRVKGVDLLLEAFFHLTQSLPQVTLTIIGDGNDRGYCAQYIQQHNLAHRVFLKGALPHNEVLQQIKAHDILVVSSRTEAMPRVILEAFAIGTVVVASSVGGIPDVVHHDKTGLLVPCDAEALAETLIEVCSDAKRRISIAHEAHRWLMQLPTWQDMIDEIIQLHSSI